MKTVIYIAVLVAFVFVPGMAEAGNITIEVTPSSAPNFFGSPSWAGYLANAMTGLQTGSTSVGSDPMTADPTGYRGLSDGAEVSPGSLMVTSFPSWYGVADPSAPFASELGNRMHFGLHAFGDGSLGAQFTLASVEFLLAGSDPGDLLAFAGTLAGTTFNGTTRIGVDWGVDRIQGTIDDILYTGNESDVTLVDELFYVGVGNAFWPGGGDPDPANPIAGRQGSIDETTDWLLSNAPFEFSGSYTITSTSGMENTGTASVVVVPEPATMALIGTGVAAMAARRKRTA